ARYHGQCLEDTNLQCDRIGHALGGFRFILGEDLVDKQKKDATEDQHVTHHIHALQQHVDIIDQQETNHCGGQKGYQEFEIKFESLKEPFPVENDHGQDGAELDSDGE